MTREVKLGGVCVGKREMSRGSWVERKWGDKR